MTELDGTQATVGRGEFGSCSSAQQARQCAPVGLLALVLIIGGIFVPSVFQIDNLANVARNAAVVGLGAVGMTFVLLTRELDLSVGSIMSLSLVIGGRFLEQGTVVALVVTVLWRGRLGRGQRTCRGLRTSELADHDARHVRAVQRSGEPRYKGPGHLPQRCRGVHLAGRGSLLGVPVPVMIFLMVIVIGTVGLALDAKRSAAVLHRSQSGRGLVLGHQCRENQAPRVRRAGLLAAMAGPLLASLTNRITPDMGAGFELGAIAVAVLGGTALAGGRGTVIGTAIGAFIFSLVSNILALSGLSTYTNQVVEVAC